MKTSLLKSFCVNKHRWEKKDIGLFLLISVISVLIYALAIPRIIFVSAGLYDGGIYQYVIFNNIKNWHSYSIHYGIPQKIFNGDPYASLYTDPLYTHSLLYLPFYLLTKNEHLLTPYFRLLQITLGAAGLSGLFLFLFHLLVPLEKRSLSKPCLLFVNIIINAWLLFVPPMLRGHLQLLPTFPWIWAILFILLFFYHRQTVHFLGLAMISLALFVTMSAYYLVFVAYLLLIVGFFISAYIIYNILRFKNMRHFTNMFTGALNIKSKALWLYVITSLSWVIISYLPYLTMVNLKIFRPLSRDNFYSLDLILSFFIPGPKWGSRLWKSIFSNVAPKLIHVGNTTITNENNFFLGGVFFFTIILGISAFWIVLNSRQIIKKFYIGSLIMLMSMLMFGLGPQLKIAGKIYNIKLPMYYLYHSFPLFKGIRVPSRIMLLTQPFLLIFFITSLAALRMFLKQKEVKTLSLFIAAIIPPLSFADIARGPVSYTSIAFLIIFIVGILAIIKFLKQRETKVLLLITICGVAILLSSVKLYRKSVSMTDPAYIFWKHHESLYLLIRDLPGNSLLEFPTVPGFHTQGAFLPGILIHHKTLVNGYSGYSPPANNTLQTKILRSANPNNPYKLLDLLCKEKIDIIVYHYDYVSMTRERLQQFIPKQMFWLDLNKNVEQTLQYFPPETQIYRDASHDVLDIRDYCSTR